jgi:hypothetical protein
VRTGEFSQAAPDPKELGENRYIAGESLESASAESASLELASINGMRFIERTRSGEEIRTVWAARCRLEVTLGRIPARSIASRGIDLKARAFPISPLAIRALESNGLSGRASKVAGPKATRA